MKTLSCTLAVILVGLAAPVSAQLVITPAPVPACTVGQTVVFDGLTWVCQPVAATPLSDSVDLFKNAADATKLLRFSLAGITTGTTRTVTWPDANLDFSGTAANRVLATGAAGIGPLTVRSLVAADIPGLDASKVTTGQFANARTTATDANTASAIVARDGSGNFSAGTISAALNGNAATATSAANADTVTNGVYTTGSYSDPAWLTISKAKVGLGNVENTALSTWAGTANITTLGTVTTGEWTATPVVWAKVDKTGSALDDIADVTIATPVLGQILRWGGSAWENADPSAVGGHAMLSAAHTDSVVGAAVRGGLIVGDPVPRWTSLAPGTAGTYLKSDGTDVSWATIPAADDASALTTGTLADARLSTNVPLKNAANTFTANQLISKTRPELQLLDSGTAKARLASWLPNRAYVASNLSWDGTNWNRDDTTLAGAAFAVVGDGALNFYYAAAGANPAALGTPLSIGSTGEIVSSRNTTSTPFVALDFRNGYSATDLWTGQAIRFGYSSTDNYSSRIVGYSNAATTYGSRLILQTHNTANGVWNSGMSMDEYGQIIQNARFFVAGPDYAYSIWTTPGTQVGTVHINPTSGTGDSAAAITFGSNTGITGGGAGTVNGAAQAGIYVAGSGSYGTKMAIATTDSFATGSKTALLIDHTGAIWMPRQPRVQYYTTQSITHATATAVSWSAKGGEVAAVGTWAAAPVTNIYPPTSGVYFVSASVNWQATTGGGERIMWLYKNGSPIVTDRKSQHTAPGVSYSNGIATTVDLTGSDYLTVYVYQSSGVTLAIANYDSYPQFKLVKLY